MRQSKFFRPRFLLALILGSTLVFPACNQNDSTVIESIGTSPSILSATINPNSINTDTVNVGTERKPDDVLPLRFNAYARISAPTGGDLSAVRAALFRENSSIPVVSLELADAGTGADTTKGDGVFSGLITFSLQRSEIGALRVELTANSTSGYQSNTFILPLLIVRGNHAPTLSSLQSPDTLKLSSQTQSILLTVRAADQDGLADIRQVVFNSFLPDGRASSGNPFRMYDDGTNGDVTLGDGVYSLRVAAPTNVGQYRFEFQASDRSNAVSAALVHTISVIP